MYEILRDMNKLMRQQLYQVVIHNNYLDLNNYYYASDNFHKRINPIHHRMLVIIDVNKSHMQYHSLLQI